MCSTIRPPFLRHFRWWMLDNGLLPEADTIKLYYRSHSRGTKNMYWHYIYFCSKNALSSQIHNNTSIDNIVSQCFHVLAFLIFRFVRKQFCLSLACTPPRHRYQQEEKIMSNDVTMFGYFMKQITMEIKTAKRTLAIKYQFRIYNAIIWQNDN